MNQKVASRFLELMGYRCDIAANGREAVESVTRQPYDIVLMDVQMPEMDGYSATAAIHERFPNGNRPQIIALTAHASVQDRELCLSNGMDDYLTKPVVPAVLAQKLRDAAARLGRPPPPRNSPEHRHPCRAGLHIRASDRGPAVPRHPF